MWDPHNIFQHALPRKQTQRNSISGVCDLYKGATSEVEVNRLNRRPKREEGAEAAILTVATHILVESPALQRVCVVSQNLVGPSATGHGKTFSRAGEARARSAGVRGVGWRACVRGGLGALRWRVAVSARCWRLWRVVARRAVRLCCWCCCSLLCVCLCLVPVGCVCLPFCLVAVVSCCALALPAASLARVVFGALFCWVFPLNFLGFLSLTVLEEFKNSISL